MKLRYRRLWQWGEDAVTDNYVRLLVAVVDRAQVEAQGRDLHMYAPAARPLIQQEATEFLEALRETAQKR